MGRAWRQEWGIGTDPEDGMQRRIMLLGALVLAGCTTSTVYYAEGVSVGERERDYALCEAEALQRHPVRTEIRREPPTVVPPQRRCDAEGNCTFVAGYVIPGDVYTVDVNADFRRNAVRGCMGGRGYDRMSLPYCEEGTAVIRSPVMAPLTSGTCILRQSGPDLVVNPA
ncbi:hypothetical protein KUV65_02725 [Maritalea mobilis]|uniref:hypothetical protein n=1 Tax=Maritalea mobilis TaxID=483324 RepID=UPI001C94191E|nr:hypothetical protein [Maritalea mobilis]MBY6200262.1 hypothetical protein [Maritalea mobilis]